MRVWFSACGSLYNVMALQTHRVDCDGRMYLLRLHADRPEYELVQCADLRNHARAVLTAELARLHAAAAADFTPGLPMSDVERAWHEVADAWQWRMTEGGKVHASERVRGDALPSFSPELLEALPTPEGTAIRLEGDTNTAALLAEVKDSDDGGRQLLGGGSMALGAERVNSEAAPLSAYEIARLDNIAANEAHLRQLGLLPVRFAPVSSTFKVRRSRPLRPAAPSRRSPRFVGQIAAKYTYTRSYVQRCGRNPQWPQPPPQLPPSTAPMHSSPLQPLSTNELWMSLLALHSEPSPTPVAPTGTGSLCDLHVAASGGKLDGDASPLMARHPATLQDEIDSWIDGIVHVWPVMGGLRARVQLPSGTAVEGKLSIVRPRLSKAWPRLLQCLDGKVGTLRATAAERRKAYKLAWDAAHRDRRERTTARERTMQPLLLGGGDSLDSSEERVRRACLDYLTQLDAFTATAYLNQIKLLEAEEARHHAMSAAACADAAMASLLAEEAQEARAAAARRAKNTARKKRRQARAMEVATATPQTLANVAAVDAMNGRASAAALAAAALAVGVTAASAPDARVVEAPTHLPTPREAAAPAVGVVGIDSGGAACVAHAPDEDAPDEFICPITQELMQDPVMASDGHTYERCAIERWFARRQIPTSPKTGCELETTAHFPNHLLRNQILDWKAPPPMASPRSCLGPPSWPMISPTRGVVM